MKNKYILALCLLITLSIFTLRVQGQLSPIAQLEESWFLNSLSDTGTYILESETYTVWGCSPIYDDEGKVHVYFSRWPREGGSWLVDSEIAHAVADRPEGPYKVLGTILKGRGEGYWDANSIHNPSVYRVGDQYVLLYIGNNISKAEKWREKAPEANSQRIGIAISDSPYGPWKRSNEPVISVSSNPNAWDEYCVVNPAFIHHPNGEFWIYYRAWDRNHDDRRKTGVAFANNLKGPYVKYEGNPIIDKWEGLKGQTEDPVMFLYKDQFHCIIRDMGNYNWLSSLYLSSSDGLNWSAPQRAKFTGSHYFDVPEESRFERDQVLMKDGVPEYLFSAIQRPQGSCGAILKISIQ